VHVADADTGHALEEGTDFTVQPGVGDGEVVFPAPTAAVKAGMNVTVSYLALPITSDSVATATVNVPSSARPAAPKVLYVLPTFSWSGGPGESTRTGTGLRVYLDRPWYATGADERLGVVVWPGPFFAQPNPPDDLVPYVTQWGLDPLFASPPPKSRHPTVASFPLADKNGLGLTLDELPSASGQRRRTHHQPRREFRPRTGSSGSATSMSTSAPRTRRSFGSPSRGTSRTPFRESSSRGWCSPTSRS